MKASEMSNKGIASHLQQMTETGLFKQVPPAARAVFVEAIERLKETDADRSLAGACREWLKSCTCASKDKAWECEECTKAFHEALYTRAKEHDVSIGKNSIG